MTTKQIIVFGILSGAILALGDIYNQVFISIFLFIWALISSGALLAQWKENKALFKQNTLLYDKITPLQDKIIRLEKELSHYTNQAISQAVLSPKEYNILYEMNQKNKSKKSKNQE